MSQDLQTQMNTHSKFQLDRDDISRKPKFKVGKNAVLRKRPLKTNPAVRRDTPECQYHIRPKFISRYTHISFPEEISRQAVDSCSNGPVYHPCNFLLSQSEYSTPSEAYETPSFSAAASKRPTCLSHETRPQLA